MFTRDTIAIFVTASAVLGSATGSDNIFMFSQSVLCGGRTGVILLSPAVNPVFTVRRG